MPKVIHRVILLCSLWPLLWKDFALQLEAAQLEPKEWKLQSQSN